MAEGQEASPKGKLTFNETQANNIHLSPDEQDFWQNCINRAGSHGIPSTIVDPIYYLIYVLLKTEDFIRNGTRGSNGLLSHEDERAKLTPMYDTIHRIKTAYQILAHPRCRLIFRTDIERALANDKEWHERDQVTLSDKEAMILTAITESAGIPIDPKKRTYEYSDVSYSPESGPLVK